MAQLKQITPILGYTKASDELFLGRLNAIYTGTSGNPAYPNPPIDMAAFKADIDSYSGLITQALDGGKKVNSEKKKKREALAKTLRLLGRYVEIMCKNDMPTFLSSGLEAASMTRTPAPPLPPAGNMDNGDFRQRENCRAHRRVDARYELCISGSCLRQVGLHGLE